MLGCDCGFVSVGKLPAGPALPESLRQEPVAEIHSAAAEVGQGVHTIMAQVARSLLGVENIDGAAAEATLGAVLKDHDDLELAMADLPRVVGSGTGG